MSTRPDSLHLSRWSLLRRRPFFLARLLLVFALALSGHASTVQFNSAKSYPVGQGPNGVAAADLNGDGRLDVVVANSSGTLSVLLGKGDGTFPEAITFTAGTNLSFLAAVDLNGDNKPDLIITDMTSTGTQVGVLLNNGDATFGTVQILPSITSASSLALADLNGDLKTDIAVGDSAGPTVHIFLGNGDGTFQTPINLASSVVPMSIHAAEFNGDNRQDLAITRIGGFDLWQGNGDGTFQAPVFTSTGYFTAIVTGDLNNDGKTDVAALSWGIFSKTRSLTRRLGNGDGTFQPSISVGTSNGSLLAVADFDGDEVPDVFAAGSGSVNIWLNNGDATFQSPVSFAAGASSAGAAAADLNGDGATDLIVTNPGQNTVSVLLNAATQFSLSSLMLNPSSITRGQSTTATLTVNLLNSFAKPIALSCKVAASGQSQGPAPTCSLEPGSVSPAANASATAKLTVNTSSALALARHALLPFAIASFGLICLICDSSNKRRLALFAVFGGLSLQVACGGGGSTPSPPSSYTITVTAKAGAVQETTTTLLTVQ